MSYQECVQVLYSDPRLIFFRVTNPETDNEGINYMKYLFKCLVAFNIEYVAMRKNPK